VNRNANSESVVAQQDREGASDFKGKAYDKLQRAAGMVLQTKAQLAKQLPAPVSFEQKESINEYKTAIGLKNRPEWDDRVSIVKLHPKYKRCLIDAPMRHEGKT